MPQPASANSVWPQPRHLAAVAGAWSLFVVYGSLTPFDFQPLPWEDAARIVSWIVEQPLGPTTRGGRSRSDVRVERDHVRERAGRPRDTGVRARK